MRSVGGKRSEKGFSQTQLACVSRHKVSRFSVLFIMNYKTWIEISGDNLHHNINQFRACVGDAVKVAAVVKSNAYGHGLVEVAKAVEEQADFFGVDSVDEAISLRRAEIGKPILILGYTMLTRLAEVVENGFHQVVSGFETLEALAKIASANKPALVHLKIETGTSRQGIWSANLLKFLEFIKANPQIQLAGMSTHFANVEDTTDHSYARAQLKVFQEAVATTEGFGFKNFIKHTACSAAALVFPEARFDMIRLGISLYGLWSSDATKVSARQIGLTNFVLKPCLTWKTRIAQIKDLPAGTNVGYGCTEKVNVSTKIAILPVGYWDGYDRGLSSVGNVLICGQRCRVLGRVCMNMTIVDVSHVEHVQLEDEVVLLGQQGREEITAEEMARKCQTINYEVVTRINPVIKRVICG